MHRDFRGVTTALVMRVYAATLWLSAEKGPHPALATVASWMSGAERRNALPLATRGLAPGQRSSAGVEGARLRVTPVTTEALTTPGIRTLSSGATLDVAYTESGSPYL